MAALKSVSSCWYTNWVILLPFVFVGCWDATNASAQDYIISPLNGEYVWAVAVAPNSTLCAAVQSGDVHLFECVSGKRRNTITSKSRKQFVEDMKDWIMGLCFSPDGQFLAGARGDGTVSLWNVNTLEEIARLDAGKLAVLCVRFSPDGTLLAAGGRDRKIRIWDVKERKSVAELNGEGSHWIHSISFTPDGLRLAAGCEEGTVRLWDLTTRKELWKGAASNFSVQCVCVTPDGKTVLAGDQYNKVQLWDADTGARNGVFAEHTNTVEGLCVLPDNRTVISAGGDRKVRVWDLSTRQQRKAVLTKEWKGAVISFAISNDGKSVICGLFDAVRLFSVEGLLPKE